MAESTARTPTPSQTNQNNSKNGSSTERSSGTGSGESSTNTPSAKKKKGGGLGNHDTASNSGLAGLFASLCGGKKAKQAFDEEPLSTRHTGSRPITGVSQHSGSKAPPAAPVTTKQVSPDIEVATTKRLSTGETDTTKPTSATTRLPMTSERVPDETANGTQITNGTETTSINQPSGLDGHSIQAPETGIGKDLANNGHVGGNEKTSGNLAPALVGATAMGVGAAVLTSTSGGFPLPQAREQEIGNVEENDNTVNGATQRLKDLHLPQDVIVATGHPLPLEETEGMTSAAVQAPGSGPTFVPATGPHAHHHHLTPHISRAATPISNTPSRSQSQLLANHATDTATNNDISDDSFLSDSTSSNGRSSVPVGVHNSSQNGVGLGILPNSTGNMANNQAYSNADTADDDDVNDEDDMNMYADGLDADDDFMDEEDRLIRQGGIGIPVGPDGKPAPLLPPLSMEHQGRKCLVLDLDETLLHSSFKMIPSADFIVPVEIESQTHNVYVIKRPGVDMFLKAMGEIYEVVVFTASLSKYADPVLDMLDIHKVVKHRLFRESCYNHKGNYVKDLSQLGREIHTSIIIDNSPASYIFHPNNAVPVSTWFNDPHDTELTDLSPFLADLATVDDVRGVLDGQL
ncbi:hypothetical protein QFC22_000198 [Naganishia vaughanmartiniae]|uniref:Uncharacterized protein n=1 Tax=Naganishia vaughanmartiniae TaxID=1424756 RepID=A0ACC2XMN6_9TREE|nr:hypothetical protein QFC22_000198 [Naganishia vaughanmartiniae]